MRKISTLTITVFLVLNSLMMSSNVLAQSVPCGFDPNGVPTTSCTSPEICSSNNTCINPSTTTTQESPSRQGANTTAINGRCGTEAIDTAIGCIPISSSNGLIGFILRWGVGIGGGIAFILILIAGFQIITSRGDPKQLQAGQELLTSAIAGLLMLIFSVIILRIIGVDILGIKELGGGTTGLP